MITHRTGRDIPLVSSAAARIIGGRATVAIEARPDAGVLFAWGLARHGAGAPV
jgi:hypothetical protein